jgi:hypothetical protein
VKARHLDALDLIAGHPRTGGVRACKSVAEATTLDVWPLPSRDLTQIVRQ